MVAKFLPADIETAEAATIGSDPKYVRPVLVYRVDSIGTQACRINRIVSEVPKFPGGGIGNVESAPVGADPERAGVVDGDRGNEVAAEGS